MSEQLKFIVERLNQNPYNKNFNLISFDSANSDQLLQILSDVLAQLDSIHHIDIRTEEPEATTIRILTALRIFKYKPGPDVSPKSFRQGLVQGDKRIIHPILEWLLRNMDDLRKRAYLAQFLVKLEIPPDIMGDADIAHLYEQYENVIEEFKLIHKEVETTKSSGYSINEIKSDMDAMEKEREILKNRINIIERKVENVPNRDAMLTLAHKLRLEREREKELLTQHQEEHAALSHRDQRLQRLQQQLKDVRRDSVGATPEGLLQRLEEETNINSYLAKQKLPKEIESKQQEVSIMNSVLSEPAMGRAHLDTLNAKIQTVNTEINQLVQRHLATSNPAEDKLAPFRQQAAIIARKKDSTAEQLAEMRARVSSLDDELQEKQSELRTVAGDSVLRGDEFKRYVNKLKGRSSLYKRQRSQLAALKAESGVLMRTLDILKAKTEDALKSLSSAEIAALNAGSSGDQVAAHEEEVSTKSQTMEQLSASVVQLNDRIAGRKSDIAPLVKELRPLRERCQEITAEYDKAKQAYDSAAAGLDSSIARLQQDVQAAGDQRQSWASECHLLEAKSIIFENQLQRVAEELNLYKSGDNADKTRKSLREQLGSAILEQEKRNRVLKEEQKSVQETHVNSHLQRQLWDQIHQLMNVKMMCLQNAKKNSGTVTIMKGSETLVLD